MDCRSHPRVFAGPPVGDKARTAAPDLREDGHGCELEKVPPLEGAEEQRFGLLDGWGDAFTCTEGSHRGVEARVAHVSPLGKRFLSGYEFSQLVHAARARSH